MIKHNVMVKVAERGCAIPEEQVFRTCELMPSGIVAESESRVDKPLYLMRCKRQSPGAVGYDRKGWVPRVRG